MAEIIHYREYRLLVEVHTPGLKILIYPPDSSLPLPTIPFHRDQANLGLLVEEAENIVDDHRLMTGVRREGSDSLKGSRAPSPREHEALLRIAINRQDRPSPRGVRNNLNSCGMVRALTLRAMMRPTFRN
jgi:hypothetical protein